MALTCPSCGNDRNFLVKTLQMHLGRRDVAGVEVHDVGRPAGLAGLGEEGETALNFEVFDVALRKEMLLTLGAR